MLPRSVSHPNSVKRASVSDGLTDILSVLTKCPPTHPRSIEEINTLGVSDSNHLFVSSRTLGIVVVGCFYNSKWIDRLNSSIVFVICFMWSGQVKWCGVTAACMKSKSDGRLNNQSISLCMCVSVCVCLLVCICGCICNYGLQKAILIVWLSSDTQGCLLHRFFLILCGTYTMCVHNVDPRHIVKVGMFALWCAWLWTCVCRTGEAMTKHSRFQEVIHVSEGLAYSFDDCCAT